jgi:hypothetical protein
VPPAAPTRADAVDVVLRAVAVVCEVDVSGLDRDTTLDSLDADSLVRVGLADVVEADLAARGVHVRLDDGFLGRVSTLGELADQLTPALA